MTCGSGATWQEEKASPLGEGGSDTDQRDTSWAWGPKYQPRLLLRVPGLPWEFGVGEELQWV